MKKEIQTSRSLRDYEIRKSLSYEQGHNFRVAK